MGRRVEHLSVEEEGLYIPQEVIEMVVRQFMPLIKAWRIFKGLTLEELAESSDLRIYELEQLEMNDNELSFRLEKAAQGLGIDIEQLTDL